MTKDEIWKELKKDNELNGWINPELYYVTPDEEDGYISFRLLGFKTIASSTNVVIYSISHTSGIYYVYARVRNM